MGWVSAEPRELILPLPLDAVKELDVLGRGATKGSQGGAGRGLSVFISGKCPSAFSLNLEGLREALIS